MALVLALTFAVSTVIPRLVAHLASMGQNSLVAAATTLITLAVLGGLGSSSGDADVLNGAAEEKTWIVLEG